MIALEEMLMFKVTNGGRKIDLMTNESMDSNGAGRSVKYLVGESLRWPTRTIKPALVADKAGRWWMSLN